MLRVLTSQATPGMRLAMPILHPDRGNILLNKGFTLDEALIRKLQQLNVHEIWTEYPGTEEIHRFISPSIQQQRAEVTKQVAALFAEVQRSAHVRLDYATYKRVLREMIEELALDSTASAYVTELGGAGTSELRHASEVCFLSLLLGLKLQDYLITQRKRLSAIEAKNVVSLGLGAILHDIGYREIEPDLRAAHLKTGDESDPHWQQHVPLGYRMVSGAIRPAAAGVILQHHQHYDGSGFPREQAPDGTERALAGEEIHVFARIVCVANHFDRLHRNPDGSLRPRVRVMKEMFESPLRDRFDPVVLAALPRVAPVFSPGTTVRLSSGDEAVVVDWHAAAPCRPVVRVVKEREGRCEASETRIDLNEEPSLSVIEADGVDVRGDLFDLPDELRPASARHDAENRAA